MACSKEFAQLGDGELSLKGVGLLTSLGVPGLVNLRAGAVLNPLDIGIVRLELAEIKSSGVSHQHLSRSCSPVPPLFDFRMAISQAESTAAAMVCGRAVLPGRRAALKIHLHGKGRIVDAVWILINHHPKINGRGFDHVSDVRVDPPRWRL